MRPLFSLIILTSLVLSGCPTKKPNGNDTPTGTDTTALAESSPEATTPHEATPVPTENDVAPSETASYHLYDNGIRCVTFPCPSWSAVSDEGVETKITDVDLSALGLEQKEAAALQAKLMAGHIVTGSIVKGPSGPAGEGTTFKVESLGKPKPKPTKGK